MATFERKMPHWLWMIWMFKIKQPLYLKWFSNGKFDPIHCLKLRLWLWLEINLFNKYIV